MKKAWKIRSMLSGSMPVPESPTAIRTPDGLVFGSYIQHPSPIRDGTHRFDSIHDQIPKDQLQLDTMAEDLQRAPLFSSV